MGVVLLGEPFTGFVVAGTVFVLAGIYVCSKARSAAADVA
jgi:drug/metabolite transporter (DMT)-like permease